MTQISYKDAMQMCNCTHAEPISIFCNQSTCWEAKGLSSRLIEKHMKQIKTSGFLITAPRDSSDFARCVEIVQAHGWKPRLHEMAKYGIVWSRIIRIWDGLEDLLTNDKLKELNKKLSSIDIKCGELKTFTGPIQTFELDKNYVVGSHLVQPELQEDETDLSPCVVLEKFPYGFINYYNMSGSPRGQISSTFGLDKEPSSDKVFELNDPLAKGILDALDSHVKSNTKIWYTSAFHYCPHLVSTSEQTDKSQMHFAQVYNKNQTADIGYCLLSFEPGHPLDPSSKSDEDWMVDYEGYKWVVSHNPIKLNTLYMEDGLLNACEDDEQVDQSFANKEEEKLVDTSVNKQEEKSKEEEKPKTVLNFLAVNLG